jgi:hypothetical protein
MSKPIEYGRPWWEVMKEVSEENARLKAEVERLTAFTTRTIIPNEELETDLENCRIALRVKYEEVAKFKAEVERLTKAGDAMASTLMDGGIIVSGHNLAEDWFKAKWNAAKEGRPNE